MKTMKITPKVLIFDIETSPLEVRTWGIYDQNVAVNQIVKDWNVIAWAAKWLNDKKVHYKDNRSAKNVRDDKKLLKPLWKLLDEADVVVTQNGDAFDIKKVNARFIINGFTPPSSFQKIDTKKLAQKAFAFTSNSLAYTSKALNLKHQKLDHKNYPGQELWDECLAGNKKAWNEMKKYNIQDVLATEDKYKRLAPWGQPVNFSLYNDRPTCSCGSTRFRNRGFQYNKTTVYRRFQCKECGQEVRGRTNEFKNKFPVGTTR